ncbi:EAL domain-containing protein [Vibrio coralliilyticus]|uniref:EAL domain-containing protein n=1 Tax=Vibrio coralliilyticus TaxID=190893 RepID=UPI0015608725|nr:EAL domain-containing protein [Vibrio coralliilyticus]NRF32190.1 EAL domain-containing protein [Vibrio coralliilyticus]NRF53315.1 EAL domain-containing protein [Vibrio coralliilyticus]NRG06220.1 EAL domain-containing protein [Vibrio coralliilyticus]
MSKESRDVYSNTNLCQIFNTTKEGLWSMSGDNELSFFNHTFYQQFSLPFGRVTLAHWKSLIHPADLQHFSRTLDEQIQYGFDKITVHYRVQNRQQRFVWIEATSLVVYEADGEHYLVGNHRDVSEKMWVEDYLTHAAYHDEETGVYNRRKLLDDSDFDVNAHTVFALRIPKMGELIRRWGHHIVSEIAYDLISRLKDTFGHAPYRIYRCTLDMFVVRAAGDYSRSKLENITSKLLASYFVKDHEQKWLTSQDIAIGIMTSNIKMAPDRLLDTLSKLCEHAQSLPVDRVALYTGKIQTNIERYFVIRATLPQAIQTQAISFQVQPIFSLETTQVTGYEVFARWVHPELGLLEPDEFVIVAEQLGLIQSLGNSIFQQVCRYFSTLEVHHFELFSVHLNISILELLNPQFALLLRHTVERFNLQPHYIVLELSELQLEDFDTQILHQLSQLHRHGFRLAIDQFGTSLQSLTHLIKLPVSLIKIAPGLVASAQHDPRCYQTLQILIEFSVDRDIEVIAVGIENAEDKTLIQKLGVHLYQGFLSYPPVEPNSFLPKPPHSANPPA